MKSYLRKINVISFVVHFMSLTIVKQIVSDTVISEGGGGGGGLHL